MRKLSFIILLLSLINQKMGYGQKPNIPDLKKQEFTISSADSVIVFEVVSKKDPNIKVQNDRKYYWYYANAILITNGGYDGKLLNGNYTSFFINKNLKEKGKFKDGLKIGEWKIWYENGNLKEVSFWKNGLKNGDYTLFEISGDIIEKCLYKDNKVHGNRITFKDQKIESITKFKNGKVKESDKESKKNTTKDDNKNDVKKTTFLKNWNAKKKAKNNSNEELSVKKENLVFRLKKRFKKSKPPTEPQNIQIGN